jgi:hypothetical protein
MSNARIRRYNEAYICTQAWTWATATSIGLYASRLIVVLEGKYKLFADLVNGYIYQRSVDSLERLWKKELIQTVRFHIYQIYSPVDLLWMVYQAIKMSNNSPVDCKLRLECEYLRLSLNVIMPFYWQSSCPLYIDPMQSHRFTVYDSDRFVITKLFCFEVSILVNVSVFLIEFSLLLIGLLHSHKW